MNKYEALTVLGALLVSTPTDKMKIDKEFIDKITLLIVQYWDVTVI